MRYSVSNHILIGDSLCITSSSLCSIVFIYTVTYDATELTELLRTTEDFDVVLGMVKPLITKQDTPRPAHTF